MRQRAVVAILLAVLLACGGDDTAVPLFSSEPANVEVGDTMVISVEENPSIGDAWLVATPPDEAVVRVVEDHYQTDDPDEVGAGGTRVFTLEAVGPGSTSVTLHNCFRCDDNGNTPPEVEQEAVDRTYDITVG